MPSGTTSPGGLCQPAVPGRGGGRRGDGTDALRNDEPGRAVPAGVVEHEEEDAVPSSARFPGEEGQHILEVLLGDAGGEIPEALARGGRGKSRDGGPLAAA